MPPVSSSGLPDDAHDVNLNHLHTSHFSHSFDEIRAQNHTFYLRKYVDWLLLRNLRCLNELAQAQVQTCDSELTCQSQTSIKQTSGASPVLIVMDSAQVHSGVLCLGDMVTIEFGWNFLTSLHFQRVWRPRTEFLWFLFNSITRLWISISGSLTFWKKFSKNYKENFDYSTNSKITQ